MGPQEKKQFRRWRSWLQVSLRLFMFLVTMLCVLLTGWHYYVAPYQRQTRAIAKLREMGMHITTRAATRSNWLCEMIDEDIYLETVVASAIDHSDVIDQMRRFRSGERLKLDDRVLEECQFLIGLETLDMRSTSITNVGLRHIRGLSTLRRLFLGNTDISDEGLSHVSVLTGLSRLELKDTKVTDLGLAKLASLHKLEYFSLASPNVEGAGLVFLHNCSNLTELQFTGASATNEWVKCAGPPPTITWLEFNSTSINEVGVALLSNCVNLKQLYLNNNPIGDAALPHLVNLGDEKLDMRNTLLTRPALEQFKEARRIRREKEIAN